MIKELLLSLAVAAFSGVSSFVGSPKKAVQTTPVSISFGFDGQYDPDSGEFYLEGNLYTSNYQNPQTFTVDGVSFTCLVYAEPAGDQSNFSFEFDFPDEGTIGRYGLDSVVGTERSNVNISFGKNNEVKIGCEGDFVEQVFTDGFSADFYFDWEINTTVTYQLSKTFVNCDIASSPVLPSTYTDETAPIKPSYYVLMVSNAGGYGFTSESVTQTGGIVIRNFNLFDEYNDSGYYASCSFNVDLPFNDCSIKIEAFLPTNTITTNLERCTVSPAIPSSYPGTSFSGDYTFTAESGYGFNKNYTHWEVTNLFIDRVEFSSLLWGYFYSSVTLHLRASGGNSSISVTAIEYDEENYKLGYEEGHSDGWKSGYDKGHADGEIAGDSYGVWNWLKQAALTTGEFLNINLLPGFSIGALLTALAGLMIIWLFIKGFLFKS